MKQPPLVQFLQDPANHCERPERVELLETHISWVFLTDRFAYKLKKPVRFAFVDFSTVAKRKEACFDELRLNRRLAPDVYLDVRPLAEARDGGYRWAGPGEPVEPVDWVVKMRRLPAHACLLQRLQEGSVSDRQIEALANFFADYYRQQAPLTLQAEQVRARLAELIRSNQADLCRILPDHCQFAEQVHDKQLAYLASHAELFDSRVCDGRFVDGHGDLRPEHIYLLPQPVVIDCIEFSPQLRHLDILDELGFLSMECDHIGHPEVGERIIERYRQVTGDHGPASLLAFYKSYRACVRAKVCALRGAQAQGSTRTATLSRAVVYLAMAEREQSQLSRPRLIVVSGLMGTGKSTLAVMLAERLGAKLLQTDQLRRDKFGSSSERAGYGEGLYRRSLREEIYDDLLRRADELLEHRHSVVLDGTFSAAQHRQAAQQLADRQQADYLLVRCECPRELAIDRIEQRRSQRQTTSEARGELYDRQAAAWEADGAARPGEVVDTRLPVQQQVDQVLTRMAALSAAAAGQPT
jgi:aminoglycoside phosphotransferase family enzyme/predicted kinase